ncbi:PREDICTED: zinc finger protein Aiolos-like isoform X2 [Papilio polytes]|uniref:zinc finger protein Aiolos-like isoform X2 n=1 Tax=Papilio polytes TaxID=76194 RepID=UPI000676508D|nr:PREDICTED: zinc finger protein Aiolos-like isoform X2 [Papilio polytes]
MDSCRVCMDEKADLSDIFTSDIADKIFFCTGIQITKDDGLPSQICDVCFNNLSIAYNFKTQCLLTERTLKNINIDIKYDVTEESGNTDEGVGNDFDLKEEESEVDVHIKVEPVDNRRSTRIKLMKIESITENEVTKVRKKRGPYKKTGQTRLSKFKYRKLFCEPCGLKFMDKEESDKHKKEIHKGESFICEVIWYYCVGVKLYQCKHCTASYHASSNLTSHIRRCHTRERRHACHLCDRAFYDRTKLNRHIDSHNDIKRFECDICHACFSRRCYWKKHLQRQHGVVVPPQRPGRQKTNRQVGTGSHTNVMAL